MAVLLGSPGTTRKTSLTDRHRRAGLAQQSHRLRHSAGRSGERQRTRAAGVPGEQPHHGPVLLVGVVWSEIEQAQPHERNQSRPRPRPDRLHRVVAVAARSGCEPSARWRGALDSRRAEIEHGEIAVCTPFLLEAAWSARNARITASVRRPAPSPVPHGPPVRFILARPPAKAVATRLATRPPRRQSSPPLNSCPQSEQRPGALRGHLLGFLGEFPAWLVLFAPSCAVCVVHEGCEVLFEWWWAKSEFAASLGVEHQA